MTAKNDITGDSITNSKGNQSKYSDGWDRIFGKKDKSPSGEMADTEVSKASAERLAGSSPASGTK